jgi:A/G-specific adenine glycosylase
MTTLFKKTQFKSIIYSHIEETLDRENPRRWYWALMDYDATLKKLKVNPNRHSAHYKRQSNFNGSFRQLRGRLIRTLSREGPGKTEDLQKRIDLDTNNEYLYHALKALEKESLVAEQDGIYRI